MKAARRIRISGDEGSEVDPAVEPILQDGQVVGLSSRCSCGKVAQILFEYEDMRDSRVDDIEDSGTQPEDSDDAVR